MKANLNPLPSGWELRECKDYPGRVYYFNVITHESKWIRPVPFNENEQSNWPPILYFTKIVIHDHSKDAKIKIEHLKEDLEKGIKKIKQLDQQYIHVSSAWYPRQKLVEEFNQDVLQISVSCFSNPFPCKDGWCILYREE